MFHRLLLRSRSILANEAPREDHRSRRPQPGSRAGRVDGFHHRLDPEEVPGGGSGASWADAFPGRWPCTLTASGSRVPRTRQGAGPPINRSRPGVDAVVQQSAGGLVPVHRSTDHGPAGPGNRVKRAPACSRLAQPTRRDPVGEAGASGAGCERPGDTPSRAPGVQCLPAIGRSCRRGRLISRRHLPRTGDASYSSPPRSRPGSPSPRAPSSPSLAGQASARASCPCSCPVA